MIVIWALVQGFRSITKRTIQRTSKGCSDYAMTFLHLQYRAKSVNLTNQTRNITIAGFGIMLNFATVQNIINKFQKNGK